jgi:peptidoglycan/LPS O-acetylase OafA/YrhL
MKTSFPFNPAAWSIFFEMVASFLFFFFFGRASRGALIVVAVLAWLVLVATVTVFGTIDLGYASVNFIAGFPRVIFSFTVGVLIQRAYAQAPWRCRAPLFCSLLATWLALVQARVFLADAHVHIFDLVMVTTFLPCLLVVGAGIDLRGTTREVAIVLGQTSYAVYLTQGSMIIAAAGVSQFLLGQKIYDFAPGVGFVFAAFVVLIAYLTYRYFELPARLLLRRFGESSRIKSVDADSVPPRS